VAEGAALDAELEQDTEEPAHTQDDPTNEGK